VTSVGAFALFLGVQVMPSPFSVVDGAAGSDGPAFDAVAVVAVLCGAALLMSRPAVSPSQQSAS